MFGYLFGRGQCLPLFLIRQDPAKRAVAAEYAGFVGRIKEEGKDFLQFPRQEDKFPASDGRVQATPGMAFPPPKILHGDPEKMRLAAKLVDDATMQRVVLVVDPGRFAPARLMNGFLPFHPWRQSLTDAAHGGNTLCVEVVV